ncbi:DUF4251 domain-containing protein [Mucilaginibacter sp. HD30]
MKKLVILSVLWLAILGSSSAQTTKAQLVANKVVSLNEIMKSRNYIFKANAAYTPELERRPLPARYEVTISDGKLHVLLPLFHRYDMGSMDPYEQNGSVYKVLVTDFDYKAEVNKKGNWTVSIVAKTFDGLRLKLNVDRSGYAQLYVRNGTSQQFVGVVESNSTDIVQDKSL